MSTMRRHPDLGGDHETAALINEAYETLSDPAKRAVYDEARAAKAMRASIRADRDSRTASGADSDEDSDSEVAATAGQARKARDLVPRCPFCRHAVMRRMAREPRCERCQAPLRPVSVPQTPRAEGERRGIPRVSKADWAVLHLVARDAGLDVRLRDLSPDGISIFSGRALPMHQRIRIRNPQLDVIADVVACRRAGTVFTVHAVLVTAYYPHDTGVFVSATA
jgi:curved DNA-binding protein CbpA